MLRQSRICVRLEEMLALKPEAYLMATSGYFYRTGDDEVGPLNKPQLFEAAQKGRIDSESLIRRGTSGPWVPACNVRGLLDNKKLDKSRPIQLDSKLSRIKILVVAGVMIALTIVGLIFRGGEEVQIADADDFASTGSSPDIRSTVMPDSLHAVSSEPVDSLSDVAQQDQQELLHDESQNKPQQAPATSEPKSDIDTTVSSPSTRRPPIELVELIKRIEPAVVRFDVEMKGATAIGSGFVVDNTGLIVTNYHVVEGAISGKVTFSSGKSFRISGVRHADPKRDLVLVICDGLRDSPTIPVAAMIPQKGERVAAFGAPKGLDFSASEGIVSGLRSSEELRQFGADVLGTWLQTTSPISGGNSGGPLVNSAGEVVGINTMTLRSGQNLNFAISCEDIRSALEQSKGSQPRSLADAAPLRSSQSRSTALAKSESPRPPIETRDGNGNLIDFATPTIGLSVTQLDTSKGHRIKDGVTIEFVDQFGPSASSGFTAGDIIIQVGEYRVRTPEDFRIATLQLKVGEQVLLRGYSLSGKNAGNKNVYSVERQNRFVVPIDLRTLRMSWLKEEKHQTIDAICFSHKSSFKLSWTADLAVSIFKTRDGKLSLRWTVQARSQDRRRLRAAVIKIDDIGFLVTFDHVVERQERTSFYEVGDSIIGTNGIAVLKALLEAEDVSLQVIGQRDEYTTVGIMAESRMVIKQTLEAYELLYRDHQEAGVKSKEPPVVPAPEQPQAAPKSHQKFETRDADGKLVVFTTTPSLGIDASDGKPILERWKKAGNRLEVSSGIVIDQVMRGDDDSRLKPGDVIYQFDSRPIGDSAELARCVRDLKPGATAPVYVLRANPTSTTVTEVVSAVPLLSEYDVRLNRVTSILDQTNTIYTLRASELDADRDLNLIPEVIVTQQGVPYFWVRIQATGTGPKSPTSFDVSIGEREALPFWKGGIFRKSATTGHGTVDEIRFTTDYDQMDISIDIARTSERVVLHATGTGTPWQRELTDTQKREFLHALQVFEIFHRRLQKLPL
jgi:S1-C subfamily serine protease